MTSMTDQLPGDVRIARDEPLSRHTYIRLGGPAQFYAEPATRAELDRLVAWAIAEQLPLRVLGGGSNLLVADAGVPGLVLSLRRCCGGIGFEGERVVAGAAVMLPALARAAAERSLVASSSRSGSPVRLGVHSSQTPALAMAATSAGWSTASRCWALAAGARCGASSCNSPTVGRAFGAPA